VPRGLIPYEALAVQGAGGTNNAAFVTRQLGKLTLLGAILKSLVPLLQHTLHEMGSICSVDTTQDLKTILRRFSDEGDSFFTITLSTFGKDFEQALAQEQITHSMFRSFAKHRRLPRLFGGFVELVFDRCTGVILDDPSIDAIRSIRQITLMWGKVLIPCTDDRITAAFNSFIKCEKELIENIPLIPRPERERFRILSNIMFGEMFRRVDSDIQTYELSPKHGPGATSEGRTANGKYTMLEWPQRLENVFPYWRYATSRSYDQKVYDTVQFLEPGAEIPVRVVAVPKTLKTPRIIAIEPTPMQYMQQGLLDSFTRSLSKDYLLRSMISTEFQEPNQLLARKGSSDGSLATLDLSEASDRVSNQLALDLFGFTPHLNDAVQASRSTHADVPEFGVVPLSKFASMGSALCFPVEMYVFLTLVFMGIEKAYDTKFTNKSQLEKFIGKVRVYGDDIIVPVDTAASVISTLEQFCFKVNKSKSFWSGKFRESCGAEYFDGHDVTLTRVRRTLPSSRKDVENVESTVDLRNQLYKRGYWSIVRYLDNVITDIIPFPAVADTSPALGKFSFLGYEEQKMSSTLHRPMVKACTVRYDPRKSIADGDAALMKFFIKRGEEPIYSKDHLSFAGRPVSSSIKYGWVHSY